MDLNSIVITPDSHAETKFFRNEIALRAFENAETLGVFENAGKKIYLDTRELISNTPPIMLCAFVIILCAFTFLA